MLSILSTVLFLPFIAYSQTESAENCDDCAAFNITAVELTDVADAACPDLNVDPSPSDSSDEASDPSENIYCGATPDIISSCLILGDDSSSDSDSDSAETTADNVLTTLCIEYDIGGDLEDLCFDNETVAIFLPFCNNTETELMSDLDALISPLTLEDGTNVALAEGDFIDGEAGIVIELTANNVTSFTLCLTNIILTVDEQDTINIDNLTTSMGSLLINDSFIIDCDFDGLPCFNFLLDSTCAGAAADDSGDSSAIAVNESISGSISGSASGSASESASGSGSVSGASLSVSGASTSGDSESGSASGVTAGVSGSDSGEGTTGGSSSGEVVLSTGTATASSGDSSEAGTGTVTVVASTNNAGSSSEVVVVTPAPTTPTAVGATPSPVTPAPVAVVVSGSSSDSDEVVTPAPVTPAPVTPAPTAAVTVPTTTTTTTTPAPTAAVVSVNAGSASSDAPRIRTRTRTVVVADDSSDDSSDDDAKAIFGENDEEEYAVVHGGETEKLEVNFSHWTLANIWGVMIGFGALNVFLYYCVGCGGKKGKKASFNHTEEPDMNDFGNGNDSDSA